MWLPQPGHPAKNALAARIQGRTVIVSRTSRDCSGCHRYTFIENGRAVAIAPTRSASLHLLRPEIYARRDGDWRHAVDDDFDEIDRGSALISQPAARWRAAEYTPPRIAAGAAAAAAAERARVASVGVITNDQATSYRAATSR